MIYVDKKWIFIGLGLFILIMFILPFGFFLFTGEFPKGYPIQVSKKEVLPERPPASEEKETKEITKYVCPDGTVVVSPELCPQKETPTKETKQAETKTAPGKVTAPIQTCQPDSRYKLCADLSKESVIQPAGCKPLPSQVVSFIEQCKPQYNPSMLSYTKDEKGCITQCCACGPLEMKEETAAGPGAMQPQTLIKGEVELDLGSVTDESVKNYFVSWYNQFYPILKNITGGPCQPFKAAVNYSSSGGGGSFQASGLGQNATIIFGMPLDTSKAVNTRFDSRFGHEFSHSFMNGIRNVGVAPEGGLVSASFISEGFAESVISTALYELVKAGKTDYKGIGFYLPYVVASYDSYVIQGKNIAGGALMWKSEYTGYYYEQAEAVWYLLEQAQPGFIKEFMKEACSLSQKKEGDKNIIYLYYEQFKNILEKIFANTKIEGKNVLDWFNSQPITSINGESGNYVRLQFYGRGDKDQTVEGRSINPYKIIITAIQRALDPNEGPRDSQLSATPLVKLIDWQGNTQELSARSGKPASAVIPNLNPGAYQVEVTDTVLNIKNATYFISSSNVDEDSLYGIKLENGKIVTSGTIKTSLGDVQINSGFFVLKVPAGVKEVNFPDIGRTVLKPAGMARMIIL